MAVKVKLRKKVISGSRESLYLDFYPPIIHPETGVPTRREFLGYYIIQHPRNQIDRDQNKEILQIAERIRQLREVSYNKPEIYTHYEKEKLKQKSKGEKNFVTYFKELADQRKGSNNDNWLSAYHYLKEFTKGVLLFRDIDVKVSEDFRYFLLNAKSVKNGSNRLSQNSAHSYFNKYKAALKQAFRDEYLSNNINGRIEAIRQAETKRNFLSIEELNVLSKTECNHFVLKRAALFSALTGLRFSDIQKLLWSEIEYSKEQGYFIHYKQQKTKGIEVLPISEQAYSILGERSGNDEHIFVGLTYSATTNEYLAEWIKNAGITKKITFHCFRHTYATLLLSKGADIYTVSNMLGHREIKTTQIYAKVIDKTKREAADRIKLDL